MRKLSAITAITGLSVALAACGSSDDASTEAMPDTVEVAADDALDTVTDEPVEDEDAAGPPIDPSETAPSQAVTEQAADAAADVAAQAEAAAAALDQLDAGDVIDAAADAAADQIEDQ